MPQWLHAALPALRGLQRGRETEWPAAPLVFSHPHLYWTWRPVLALECTLFFGMGGILSVGFQMSWADMQAVSPGSAVFGRPCLSPEGLRGKGPWSRLPSEDGCGAPVNPLCLLKAVWVFCFIRSFYVFSRPSGFFSRVPLAVSKCQSLMNYSCLFHTCWVCNSTVLALCTFGLRCCLEPRGGRAAFRKQSLFSKWPAGLSITSVGLAANAEPAAVTSALLPTGTSSGAMACWDMRFQLPISSHCHPARARVRRLSMHPLYQSWVIAGRRRVG